MGIKPMVAQFRSLTLFAMFLSTALPGCSRPANELPAAVGESVPPLPKLTTTSGWDPLARIDGRFDNSGYQFAQNFTGEIKDLKSISELRAAFENRGNRGIEVLSNWPGQLTPGQRAMIGVLHMYEGDFEKADSVFVKLGDYEKEIFAELGIDLAVLRGVANLRLAEVENCNECCNNATCIFPLGDTARHRFPVGTEAAMGHFARYLAKNPTDISVRWLLNVSAMAVGKFPDGVPEAQRMRFPRESTILAVPRFENVAPEVGILKLGPMMAGGSSFEDFDGDFHPDIFFSSYDYQRGAMMLINRKNGKFEEKPGNSNWDAQTCSLNSIHADFDNDGAPDILLMRGGWERPLRLSLMKNRGDATFDDVTNQAGLTKPISTMAAGWADYDLDGDLDLFVAAEGADNRACLYRNDGGAFFDVAEHAGVTNDRHGKGVAWGDYDDDGDPDLYVSNLNGKNRLYRNKGDGTFEDVAERLGLTGPEVSFSCWFFDYDDDGRLDIFVNAYEANATQVIQDMTGEKAPGVAPALYRNLGPDGFENVTARVGLDRRLLPMGCNFGDINGDNFPDIYLGTGRPQYSYLMPNVMLINENGEKFVDVSADSGTGHLQKGHGVSFADYDFDGRLDLLLKSGGATPGDRAHSLLFRNLGTPGDSKRKWAAVKLEGVKSNRGAIGARMVIKTSTPEGSQRTLHRLVSTGSSFGSNSLIQTINLSENETIDSITIRWPFDKSSTQVVRKPPTGQLTKITEGKAEFQVIDPKLP